MRRLLPARVAELLRFHPFGVLLLVLRRRVVAVLAIPALQRNDFAHKPFLIRQILCLNLTSIDNDCYDVLPSDHDHVLSTRCHQSNPQALLRRVLHLKWNWRSV
jgi:hypothetical protein